MFNSFAMRNTLLALVMAFRCLYWVQRSCQGADTPSGQR